MWAATLGMSEEEKATLLHYGWCKTCGHYNMLHEANRVMNMVTFIEEYPLSCGVIDCPCGHDVDLTANGSTNETETVHMG